MKARTCIRWISAALGLLLAATGTLHAADVQGSVDHPLIPRYQGSEIVAHDAAAFDRHTFARAPITRGGGFEGNPDSALTVEGKRSTIVYRAPEQRSPLEVLRNYEAALADAGFELIFKCAQEQCGRHAFNDTLMKGSPYYTRFGGYYEDHGYLLTRLARADEGDVIASVYVVQNMGGGADARRAMVKLDVLEQEPMEQRMVTLKVAEMDTALGTEGRVAVYGLLFDTDKDTMRPDSRPQLDEIAALLASQPGLKVLIVGHTDAQGALAYNQDLSQRRARSVVNALARDYGVDAARLTPVGVGMAAPVASNRNDAGRARNRRVELVDLSTGN